MHKNKNQNKYQSFTFWSQTHRLKSAAGVFALVMVLGGGWIGVKALFNHSQPQAATVESATKYVDEIPGWWFNQYFGVSVCEKENCAKDADPDLDKLTNYQEFYYGSDPFGKDTNKNGNSDGEDVAFGYAPNKPGKIKFDEALSDDSIVGESLLFNTEVKQVVNSMGDLSKVALPEVNQTELTVVNENTQETFTEYMLKMDAVAKKYYKEGAYDTLADSIKQQNPAVLEELTVSSASLAAEYKQVPVPTDALDLHKYQIAVWSLLPSVINIPEIQGMGMDTLYDETVNEWYDNVQAVVALNQKIMIETMKLRNKYEFVK